MGDGSIEVIGKLVEIFDEATIPSGQKKREFVIETEGKYPQLLKCELFGDDKVGIIDKYTEGETVNAHCNLRGRKYEHPEKGDMYFLSLGCWRIESEVAAADVPPMQPSIGEPDPGNKMPF
jgi:hypothetical protein